MPRAAKGARLIWRKKSVKKDGTIRSRAGWWIRDGSNLYSTGCDASETSRAEEKLAAHIAKKLATLVPARRKGTHPDNVIVADVINVYCADEAHKHAKPVETIARLAAIEEFFGGYVVSGWQQETLRSLYRAHAIQGRRATPA